MEVVAHHWENVYLQLEHHVPPRLHRGNRILKCSDPNFTKYVSDSSLTNTLRLAADIFVHISAYCQYSRKNICVSWGLNYAFNVVWTKKKQPCTEVCSSLSTVLLHHCRCYWSGVESSYIRSPPAPTEANMLISVRTGCVNTLSLPLRRFHISIVYFFWLRRSHTPAWFCSSSKNLGGKMGAAADRLCFPAAFGYYDRTEGNSSTRTGCWELVFHWQWGGLTAMVTWAGSKNLMTAVGCSLWRALCSNTKKYAQKVHTTCF